MSTSPFPLSLDNRSTAPLFVRISEAVSRDVARGRLRPGDRLPGSRTLALSLGVHRSTVVAAYAELVAQGWASARPGGATTIAARSPEPQPRRAAAAPASGPAARAGFDIEPAPVNTFTSPPMPRGAIPMFGGVPDLRLVPVELLARAYRRAARRYGHALLGYGLDRRGHERLRAAIAAWVSETRGLAATSDTVMVTRGSQMALHLTARALVRPGDVVAVESLGYSHAINVFRRARAEVIPIDVDRDGLDVAALEKLAEARRVRLVYVTPHHQYPTTVVLSPTRRLALLALARRHRIAVVEDDYDQEFHYDGRPLVPMAASDAGGNVIYVGTLAKILAPGLRLGFVVAPPALLARMAAERALVDVQGDAVLECAVADLLEDGEIQRHVRRVRRIYHQRRDALCAALDANLSGVLTYARPPGGLTLWTRVAREIDLAAWHQRCLERGVFFQQGALFTFDRRPIPFARFGYAALDERSLTTAVRVLRESVVRKRGGQPRPLRRSRSS